MCLYIVQVGEVSGLIRKEILFNVQLRAINFFLFISPVGSLFCTLFSFSIEGFKIL